MHIIVNQVFEPSHAKYKLEEIVDDDQTNLNANRPGKEAPGSARTYISAVVL